MHSHCEIVIPPTDDIEGAIKSVLAPFDENAKDEDGRRSPYAFCDFWVIGGRWAGHKLMARFDQARVGEFMKWCSDEGITVEGLRAGKQRLSPASQIPKVDAKWNEMFPSETLVPCPIFAHSNDQYGKGLSGTLPDDVCRLEDVPERLTCCHVIFAGQSTGRTDPLEAKYMLIDEAWNGCNFMKVDWDGAFASALEKYRDSMKRYRDEYRAVCEPGPDWLVVTVDYHS